MIILLNECGKSIELIDVSNDITIEEDGEAIIRGTVRVTNGALITIKPGAKIRVLGYVSDGESAQSDMWFENNSGIEAIGTSAKPIIFETKFEKNFSILSITISETADSTKIHFSNCLFNYTRLDIRNRGGVIEYCKFINGSEIKFNKSSIKIYYNTFINGVIGRWGTWKEPSFPHIKFNDISMCQDSLLYDSSILSTILLVGGDSPLIEYNNIYKNNIKAIQTNTKYETYIIFNNYIADNLGKNGVDTIGEQSSNIKYYYPLLEKIKEAGCGW